VKLFKDGSLELEKSNVLIKADDQQHQEQSQDSPEIRKLKNNLSTLLEENQRLKKNVSTLEMERSILKKAAAYFAKEHL
jgi:transposase-like protein